MQGACYTRPFHREWIGTSFSSSTENCSPLTARSRGNYKFFLRPDTERASVLVSIPAHDLFPVIRRVHVSCVSKSDTLSIFKISCASVILFEQFDRFFFCFEPLRLLHRWCLSRQWHRGRYSGYKVLTNGILKLYHYHQCVSWIFNCYYIQTLLVYYVFIILILCFYSYSIWIK